MELLLVVPLRVPGRIVGTPARKRRVHNHQVLARRGHLHAKLGARFALARHRRARVKGDQRLHFPVPRQQIERTQRYSPLLGLAVLRDYRPRTVVPLRRMRRREHRRRQMHRGGQHVARRQRLLHHVRVQTLGVAAREQVKPVQPPVRRVDQRPRPAGVVRNAKVLDSPRIPPAPVVRHRQMRQKRRRLRPRVEGREELAVRDEPLEHRSRKIVGLRYPQRDQLVRRCSHHPERPGRHVRRIHAAQQVARDVEDRPVVDVENLAPLAQHAGPKQQAVVGYLF